MTRRVRRAASFERDVPGLATHEAVINVLAAAESMTGADDVRVLRLPREEVREILQAHDRLEEAP